MVSATAIPPVKVGKETRRAPLFRWTGLISILAVVAVCTVIFLASRYWPFDRKPVIQNLEEASDSRVQIRALHRTYFPYPGCILEGVVFIHGTDATKPLITIDRLTIRSTYFAVLAHHITLLNAEGMKVFIPAFGNGQPLQTHRSTITIGEIVANGATLEFGLRTPDKPPLRFDIWEASLRDVGWASPLTYRVKVHNPEPPGEITATGNFGVWNENDPEQTPVSGEYKFEHADLSVYRGIAGTLSSAGKFAGKLGHIDVSGKTETPDFEVTSGGHPVQLLTEFTAYVDGTHGDTFLKRVDAHFRKTHVVADGSIAESANGNGKIASINLNARKGRIEDLLGLFVKTDRSPMSGAITLQAKAEIPSGERPFLEKLKMHGNFGIGGGEFSKPSIQESVNKLSAGALGEEDDSDPETVLTGLTGQVSVESGLATFPDLSFGVPGASARMHGNYNLLNHRIDLHGQMQVETKMSNTTTGVKALLLKVMDPFFKKRKKGEILPVRISGTYENPSLGLDLMDKKAQVALPSQAPASRPSQ